MSSRPAWLTEKALVDLRKGVGGRGRRLLKGSQKEEEACGFRNHQMEDLPSKGLCPWSHKGYEPRSCRCTSRRYLGK